MILQYSTNGIECYEESQSICFLTIPITKEECVGDVIITAGEKISKVWGNPLFEIREDNILAETSKAVKIALLNEKDRSRTRALMFNQNTILYLLNDCGKTIRKV